MSQVSSWNKYSIRFGVMLVALVFIVELGVVSLFHHFSPNISYFSRTVLESFILILILLPVLYFFVIRRMVTLMRANEESQERLEEFSRAVEQSPSMVEIIDLDGKIEYVNPKFTEITGYAPIEVIGRNPRVLKSGEQPTEFYKELWETVTAGKEWRGEFHNKKKNGELYWEHASISAVKDDKGRPTHYLAIKEDITDRRRNQDRLSWLASFPNLSPNPIIETNYLGEITYLNRAARINFPGISRDGKDNPIVKSILAFRDHFEKGRNTYLIDEVEIDKRTYELHTSYMQDSRAIRSYVLDITQRKRVEGMKDEFVSAVSHELRTPLAIIEGSISLVLDGIIGDLNKKQNKMLGNAKESIHRLMRIINELLDISKIEAGKVIVNRESFNLVDLVKQAGAFFTPKINEKGLDLKIKTSSKDIQIYADQDKIMQVFTNLIGNAIKFTDGGEIVITIENDQNAVVCSVSDTGVGIPKENIETVFEKFKQVGRSMGEGEKGTGLGLSIAKGYVVMHGGKIWVESESGRGATFSFQIPKYTAMALLQEEASRAIQESAKAGLKTSLVMILPECDDFSGPKCDELRQGLKEVMKENLRRAGDSPFVDSEIMAVLLPECNEKGAQDVARRLSDAFKKYFEEKGFFDSMVFHVSTATYPDNATSAEELIKVAQDKKEIDRMLNT